MATIPKQHAEKKGRKRFKKLFSQIRSQMEFYFSDANLHKDRFLKQQLQETSDGYVDLDTFLRFNKIRALVDNTELLAKALSKSEILQVNEEKTKVRRIKPLEEPTNVDERTVYVECLPAGASHDWVRNTFANCGQVVYVSLPKYRSTGDIKGFAFVEFDTADAAHNACLTMNNPPAAATDEQPGKFPKSKQLKNVERQMQSCHKRKRRASESLAESNEDVPASKRRRRTFSEGEKPSFSKPQREVKLAAESSSSSSNVKSDSPVKSGDATEPTKLERKRAADGELASGRKDRKRKRTSTHSASEQELELDIAAAKAEKSAMSCQGADAVNQADGVAKLNRDSEQCSAEGVTKSVTNQKRAKKPKKEKKSKTKQKQELPRLRVISKFEWLKLRSEYLSLQKASVAQLKSSLKTLKEANSKQPTGVNGSASTVSDVPGKSIESKQAETSSLVFTPNVIIHICSNSPLSRSDLQARLSPLGSIAYIDVQDGDSSGHVRCADASSAAEIVQCPLPGCSLQLLTGEAELCYWQKAAADRQKKHSSKTSRTARRGRDKIMKRAEKADASQRKHIVFDDD